MLCLLTVLVLALTVLALSVLGANAANCCEPRGFVAVLFWFGRTSPLVIFSVCLVLSPEGVSSVAVIALTGVLCHVVFGGRVSNCATSAGTLG